jgi:hypothetical protein
MNALNSGNVTIQASAFIYFTLDPGLYGTPTTNNTLKLSAGTSILNNGSPAKGGDRAILNLQACNFIATINSPDSPHQAAGFTSGCVFDLGSGIQIRTSTGNITAGCVLGGPENKPQLNSPAAGARVVYVEGVTFVTNPIGGVTILITDANGIVQLKSSALNRGGMPTPPRP